jgi:hypothetical protein
VLLAVASLGLGASSVASADGGYQNPFPVTLVCHQTLGGFGGSGITATYVVSSPLGTFSVTVSGLCRIPAEQVFTFNSVNDVVQFLAANGVTILPYTEQGS